MECPICNNTMKDGYIPASQSKLYWAPRESLPSWSRWGVPKGGIELTGTPWLGFEKKVAHYCQHCDYIYISTKNSKRKEI